MRNKSPENNRSDESKIEENTRNEGKRKIPQENEENKRKRIELDKSYSKEDSRKIDRKVEVDKSYSKEDKKSKKDDRNLMKELWGKLVRLELKNSCVFLGKIEGWDDFGNGVLSIYFLGKKNILDGNKEIADEIDKAVIGNKKAADGNKVNILNSEDAEKESFKLAVIRRDAILKVDLIN